MKGFDGHIETLKQHYNYIEPREIFLGKRQEQRFNRKTKKFEPVEVNESFQYVPIIETLKLVMSHKEVRDYVNSEKSATDGTLTNFRDGVSFKNNIFFQAHPQALRIQPYFDEIVVNNPLGAKVHPHKVGAFYFIIQNLPDHLNSFLGGVHVFAFSYSADVSKYGMEKMLEPFLFDLARLESDEGVKYEVGNDVMILRASIATNSGDGLAIHQLFGLLSPAARHFCRQCMISRQQLKTGDQIVFQQRTKELYEEHLARVLSDPAASTETGLKENSPLNQSKYFHCTNNFSFDPMHDILEGIAQFELKLVTSHFILSGEYDFDVDTLNDRINLFQYGFPEVKNKPSANFSLTSLKSSDHKINQKAAQTWCLLRVFPFLVSDKIPENDDHLRLIILLNKINEFIFAPRLNSDDLPYLHELIIEHEDLFRQLFSHCADAINKHHHIRHYVECLQMSGPLRKLSCFLFEAKHGIFTKYGKICHNYKNIPKTLIKIAQINQAAIWGMNDYPRVQLTYTGCKIVQVDDTDSRDDLLNLDYLQDQNIMNVSTVEVYGIKYRENLLVAIDSGHSTPNGWPVFGMIQEILINEKEEVFLFCKEWDSLQLIEPLNSYLVAEGSDYRLVRVDDLVIFS